jgi:hypothetical protein
VDPAVAHLIESTLYVSMSGGPARDQRTDLDRYVRHEFRDHTASWLVAAIRRWQAHIAACESVGDARPLRRFVRAIAAIV